MGRPRIQHENIDEIINYYHRHAPSPRFAKFGFAMLNSAFHPRVEFAEGAEDAAGDILRDPTQRLMVLGNHQNNREAGTLAALVRRPALQLLIGKAFILAKPPLFKFPGFRHAIDELGAVPTFRKKDLSEGTDLTETYKKMNDLYIDITEAGGHPAGFPSGERVLGPIIKDLRKGFGHIACGVDPAVGVHVLPVGVWFERNPVAPFVYVGQPYEAPRTSAEDFTDMLEAQLQESLTRAVSHS